MPILGLPQDLKASPPAPCQGKVKKEREGEMDKAPPVTRARAESERFPLGQELCPARAFRGASRPALPAAQSKGSSTPEKRSEPRRAEAASARDGFSASPRPPAAPRCRMLPRPGAPRSLQPPALPLCDPPRAPRAALLDAGSLAVRSTPRPQRKTLPVEVMCAEEAQKHSRRRTQERAGLPGENPRGHREGGQLLQEPGGAGGQTDSRGHQVLRVLPVAGGLREVQDQCPQGGQSGTACQHRTLLAASRHRAVFPAGGRYQRRRERGPRGPFMES